MPLDCNPNPPTPSPGGPAPHFPAPTPMAVDLATPATTGPSFAAPPDPRHVEHRCRFPRGHLASFQKSASFFKWSRGPIKSQADGCLEAPGALAGIRQTNEPAVP